MAFYDALAVYLATGQTAELRAVVHPDLVDHTDGHPATNGVEEFLVQFEPLRASAPQAEWTAKSISSNGNLVVFTVSIPAGMESSVLGLPVAQPKASVFCDTLRITDGRVAERWSTFRAPAALAMRFSLAWDPPAASQILPAIERLTMLSGSSLTLQFGTAHILLVESGTLSIAEVTPRADLNVPEFAEDLDDVADRVSSIVLPGSPQMLAGKSGHRISNKGSTVARALLIRIAGRVLSSDLSALSAHGTSKNDPGVQIETLSLATQPPNHMGDWRIEVGRVTLSPGSIIPDHEVTGAELIVVGQGTLEADPGMCKEDCVRISEGVASFAPERTSVQAGQGISASNGAATAYRVAGATPATLLIVTVAPA